MAGLLHLPFTFARLHCLCACILYVVQSNSTFQCIVASSPTAQWGTASCVPQRVEFGPLLVLKSSVNLFVSLYKLQR